MEQINETHILVLKVQNGVFQVASVPLEDTSFVINELNAAADNPNKTLMDVQSVFQNNFQCLKSGYGYLYPYAYSSSYVNGAMKPKTYTYAEYRDELDRRIKERNVSDGTERERITEELKKSLKREYATSCRYYIKQQMLFKAFQQAEEDPDCKMYSRESIGWSCFEYAITEDIKVCVNTNLGYGFSSYFTLCASYKGITIAPFSHIARYYKAQMTDIIACTRDYYVERDNWHPMFDFVKDFVNHSLDNPESFVKSYIMNEIDEMMKYLRMMLSNSRYAICIFKTQSQSYNLTDYHRLRFIAPMSDNEKQLYEVYPAEMSTVFKSEKLAQAVQTLKRLEQLQAFFPSIQAYITEILGMIGNLGPEIDHTVSQIRTDIDRLIIQKADKERLIEPLQAQIDGFVAELNAQLSQLPENADWKIKEEMRKDFEKEHPEYVNALNSMYRLKDDIADINMKKYSREALVDRLSSCIGSFTPFMEKAGSLSM